VEIRRPKVEARRKTEGRNPNLRWARLKPLRNDHEIHETHERRGFVFVYFVYFVVNK
jgi:hypothetical protein